MGASRTPYSVVNSSDIVKCLFRIEAVSSVISGKFDYFLTYYIFLIFEVLIFPQINAVLLFDKIETPSFQCSNVENRLRGTTTGRDMRINVPQLYHLPARSAGKCLLISIMG
jgi:hypothetical protein